MPSQKYLLWIDLETTGSNPATEQILEVSAILTDQHLTTIAEASWLQTGDAQSLRVYGLDPVVLRMHANNGLWNDLLSAPWADHATIDASICEWLTNHTRTTQHIILAGSEVGHFDHAFIKRRFPLLAKRLAFYTNDIGPVRRFMELAGIDTAALTVAADSSTKTHRALDDIRQHLAEARIYLSSLRLANLTTPYFHPTPDSTNVI